MLMTAGLNGSHLLISVDVCEVLAKIVTHCCKMKGDEVIQDVHRQTVCFQKLQKNVSPIQDNSLILQRVVSHI